MYNWGKWFNRSFIKKIDESIKQEKESKEQEYQSAINLMNEEKTQILFRFENNKIELKKIIKHSKM